MAEDETNNPNLPVKRNTMQSLNIPLFIKGFSPGQVLIGFGVSGFVAIIYWPLAVALLIAVYFVSASLRKENIKGNPNSLLSFRVDMKTPKYLFDEGLLEFLENDNQTVKASNNE